MRFAAIDLECATSDTGNVCEVGVVVMEDRKEVGRFRSRVRPAIAEFGDWQRWNLPYTLKDVMQAPSFVEVWEQLRPLIGDSPLVAHNASTVERRHLGVALDAAGWRGEVPLFHCTWDLARAVWPDLPKHGLKVLARHLEIPLQHHNPESDARVCAEVVVRAMEIRGLQDFASLVREVPLAPYRVEIAGGAGLRRSAAAPVHPLVRWSPTRALKQLKSGDSFVMSGLDTDEKDGLRHEAESRGLRALPTVTPRIAAVVAGPEMGPAKYERCRKWHIPIVTPDEFRILLHRTPETP